MSNRTLKLALLSFWHVHAKDYALQASEHPAVELAAIWDEDAERGRAEAAARGVPYVQQLEQIWQDVAIDGVIVTAATSEHTALMLAAAKAGKHIFTEKVIALTAEQCTMIIEAVQAANVVLTVSLPRLNMPFMQGMKQLLPKLGELTLVRARLSHSGALPTAVSPHGYLPEHFFSKQQAGGGSLIDLGCHPMYVVRALLGMPRSVFAAFGFMTNKEVEDNAVVSLSYESGAIGIVEAGFVNQASPFTVELHGKHGSAIFSAADGRLIYKSMLLDADIAKQWHELELPPALPSAFEQWVAHIQAGTSNAYNVAIARDLTTLMEAAIQSHEARSPIELT